MCKAMKWVKATMQEKTRTAGAKLMAAAARKKPQEECT